MMNRLTLVVSVVPMLSSSSVHGFKCFSPSIIRKLRTHDDSCCQSSASSMDDTGDGGWGIGDNWETLSRENEKIETSSVFNQDIAANMAQQLHEGSSAANVGLSEEDEWFQGVLDEVNDLYNGEKLYDTEMDQESLDKNHADTRDLEAAMDEEISMLVRCNEYPEQFLMTNGRAVVPLTEEERDDPLQLVKVTEDEKLQPTRFLKQAVSTMFRRHAKPSIENHGKLIMDRDAVANWMTISLRSEGERKVSPHDSRVGKTISKYGKFGSGYLDQADFQDLYFDTIVGDKVMKSKNRQLELRKDFVKAVLRDIRNHGLLTPAQEQQNEQARKVRETYGAATLDEISSKSNSLHILMDECEILDWDHRSDESKHDVPLRSERRQASGSRASHKLIETVPGDENTPLYLKQGSMIFIDEESCIGCSQCASASPDSFMMVETGRFRAFFQRGDSPDVTLAVQACPVSCMHRVTLQELKEYENARDSGQYFGDRKGHIPLHVAGMDSDSNRKSSWYHTLKSKCATSGNCPEKGCYECPKYSHPGENPNFIKNQKRDTHLRAQYFSDRGDADAFRKTAEL
jgi:ferredoxin